MSTITKTLRQVVYPHLEVNRVKVDAKPIPVDSAKAREMLGWESEARYRNRMVGLFGEAARGCCFNESGNNPEASFRDLEGNSIKCWCAGRFSWVRIKRCSDRLHSEPDATHVIIIDEHGIIVRGGHILAAVALGLKGVPSNISVIAVCGVPTTNKEKQGVPM